MNKYNKNPDGKSELRISINPACRFTLRGGQAVIFYLPSKQTTPNTPCTCPLFTRHLLMLYHIKVVLHLINEITCIIIFTDINHEIIILLFR